MAEQFVLKVPLRTNPRDKQILEQRRRARAKLKNAALLTARGRIRQMRRDPEFKRAGKLDPGKERNEAFDALRARYECRGSFDLTKLTQDHWRQSRWMPLVIDSRIGDAVANEVKRELDRFVYGDTREPRPQPIDQQNTIWGWGNEHGLRWSEKEEAVIWPQPGSHAPAPTREVYPAIPKPRGETRSNRRVRRRDLRIELPRRRAPGSTWWRQRVGERRVVRVGLKRELTRKGWRWFALFCLEGQPYRNPDRARDIEAAGQAPTGIDLNVSCVAVVGPAGSTYIDRTPDREKAQAERARIRRQRRALQRSRDAGAADGKRARRNRRRLADDERRRVEQRRRDHVRAAQTLLAQHGTNLFVEDTPIAPWQRRWGRRMAGTAPKEFLKRLERELALHGGSLERIPSKLALSQTCLCGRRERKELRERVHHCPRCGLAADRDLLSALLASMVGELGEKDFCAAVTEGTLGETWSRSSGASERATEMILSPPSRVPSPSAPYGRKRRSQTALDGLADSAKVVHSGSKPPGQTDGTTARSRKRASEQSSRRRPAKRKITLGSLSLTTVDSPPEMSDNGVKT